MAVVLAFGMVDNGTRLMLRRGLLLAGFVVTGWAATRVALLLSGNEAVVAEDDRHGYVAIFSLVLMPVLAAALVALVIAAGEVWRHGRWPIGPGVALALSSPLASPVALVAFALGVVIIVVALVDRRQRALARKYLR
ncbi:hypothetical protein [Amycolatopsis sp. 195334CR]|uniref:hypothetical protein n=1 Tax=Amycolatopsis sp. 195334CR TaxID=2814588 RepID=UPI001A8D0294|nr:hypothetical protein [Amycolatopsis sp. 195334CR]MBN6041091.1 hypothetical protein [Amycolatopsis sp. 195334CR]